MDDSSKRTLENNEVAVLLALVIVLVTRIEFISAMRMLNLKAAASWIGQYALFVSV